MSEFKRETADELLKKLQAELESDNKEKRDPFTLNNDGTEKVDKVSKIAEELSDKIASAISKQLDALQKADISIPTGLAGLMAGISNIYVKFLVYTAITMMSEGHIKRDSIVADIIQIMKRTQETFPEALAEGEEFYRKNKKGGF